MSNAHFQNLPEHLCRYLSQAQHSLFIAVCWFSHKDIFDVLLARLRAGLRVELLLEYDTQNIRADGLDFQKFIKFGGQLYARREAGLMHHKFALIDDSLLLSGSFNWTFNSNAENIIACEDPALIAAFQEAFFNEKALAKRIFKVRPEDAKVFSAYPLFENTRFQLADLRKKITGSAGVWLVRIDKIEAERETVFRENQLPFDRLGVLSTYWTSWRMWDKTLFDETIKSRNVQHPASVLRDLLYWARRMRPGDVILATEQQSLIALGIVQSHPRAYKGEGFSSFRDIQWLKKFVDSPVFMEANATKQVITKFRGSALRLLQEIYDRDKTAT